MFTSIDRRSNGPSPDAAIAIAILLLILSTHIPNTPMKVVAIFFAVAWGFEWNDRRKK
jgi:hypothetical protein